MWHFLNAHNFPHTKELVGVQVLKTDIKNRNERIFCVVTKRTIHFHILLLFVNFISLLWYYFWQRNCPRPSSVHPHPMLSPDWLKQQLSPKQHCGQWEQVKGGAREESSSVTFHLVLIRGRFGIDSRPACAAYHDLLVVETLFFVTHSTAGATDVIACVRKRTATFHHLLKRSVLYVVWADLWKNSHFKRSSVLKRRFQPELLPIHFGTKAALSFKSKLIYSQSNLI